MHRRVVQPGVQEHWSERLLVPFRPQDLRHPRRPGRAQGRWLPPGRPIAGRSSVDPDDAALHRRRQRRAAQTRRDDLRAMVATAPVRGSRTNRQKLWRGLLPGRWLRRHHCSRRAADRRAAVQPGLSADFPRFVQHAIWRYCSQNGLDVCNGNRIDDDRRCANMDCRVRPMRDRVALRRTVEN
jgi:hypothetical protein